MEDEVNLVIDSTIESMEAAIERLSKELSKIRAGKANPAILESVLVDYYGSNVPISQVANLSAPDGRTVVVQPWEKPMLSVIEKAIMNANLGFNPMNDGSIIRISIPALTEERRRDLVKMVKTEGENARVSIRNARRDANEELKKMKKDGLAEDACKTAEEVVQKHTDSFTKKVEELLKIKEEDIMTV
jgi:ribosome recycling factor